jgi:ABC-type uncharacterized transport system substrate-binding protein
MLGKLHTTLLLTALLLSPVLTLAQTRPLILFVDSYHEGYEWSDGILRGIRAVLEGKDVRLEVFRMDTKRNSSEEHARSAANTAYSMIKELKPDVVIAADDNASKFLVMPYLKDTSVPVVFCGINWDASIYGYPYPNVTGMLEVDLVPQTNALLRRYAAGDRVGYLTVDSFSEQKITKYYNSMFMNNQMKLYLVKTFEAFKTAFIKAQTEVDMLYVSNYAGIDRWDSAEAEIFVASHTTIPTAARLPWMARFALLTLAKSPQEQGVWSAKTALKIINGTPPSRIPITKNRQADLIINLTIADKLGIVVDPDLLEAAEIIRLKLPTVPE